MLGFTTAVCLIISHAFLFLLGRPMFGGFISSLTSFFCIDFGSSLDMEGTVYLWEYYPPLFE